MCECVDVCASVWISVWGGGWVKEFGEEVKGDEANNKEIKEMRKK